MGLDGAKQILHQQGIPEAATPPREGELGKVGLVKACSPKTRFILWLAFLNKFKTKDRLFKLGVTPNESCPLCGDEREDIDLFCLRADLVKLV